MPGGRPQRFSPQGCWLPLGPMAASLGTVASSLGAMTAVMAAATVVATTAVVTAAAVMATATVMTAAGSATAAPWRDAFLQLLQFESQMLHLFSPPFVRDVSA